MYVRTTRRIQTVSLSGAPTVSQPTCNTGTKHHPYVGECPRPADSAAAAARRGPGDRVSVGIAINK